MEKERLISIFDSQATQYDKNRENPKQTRWRQNLLSHARGEVLELAVGAGANFPFYPPEIKLTATDFSKMMIEKAQLAAKHYRMDADFICADIEEMDFSEQSFDTIVSTLSFCSYNNPLMVLDKINRWCKPDGKILLIEHGISSNYMVSMLQKLLNPLLYRSYGCHHTRDILGLIQESGIQIEKAESYWFNMVHLVWAKPKPSISAFNC
ncbi:class I SAM-dependent methyltransferase [Paenibacillus brevis]|uniref:Class I SAM-dependent methyltransferase n=1 Tax=Paenibacillus brevis TaxID=2841508 RepID=A0ABS6FUI4_9BACL|nr:class I SAM-dependent methyltransferase [Paenibacillus brevis]MBU5672810.1 class I SAM-dependent methyltransferase [Paenibacillus brevis]